MANTGTMVVFYTYIIGFQACLQGKFCDCDQNPNSPNLCTNGAQWIRENRATIVNAYGQYAKAVYANSPNKPVIWWLEGDFIQYSYTKQSSPLRYEELGALARDITCAIKSNMPNAIVGMNHSPWITDPQAVGFWAAQPKDVLDLAWVQGAGDQDNFVNAGDYNSTSARFSWLHKFTGLKIMAETKGHFPRPLVNHHHRQHQCSNRRWDHRRSHQRAQPAVSCLPIQFLSPEQHVPVDTCCPSAARTVPVTNRR